MNSLKKTLSFIDPQTKLATRNTQLETRNSQQKKRESCNPTKLQHININ